MTETHISKAIVSVNGKSTPTEQIQFDTEYAATVPLVDPLYVPFGAYGDIEKITISRKFLPYWIYGLSGNGKTYSIEQAHAKNNRPLINIPITREADEDSLIGGLRLEGGNIVPFFGPITIAAVLGCTANLDEIDLGDEKMMCLQTALQNRPFLIKRLGKMIYPQPGFNITATANTKGKGSEDGQFIGTNVMNEAMLDRFVCTFEQGYPPAEFETQILKRVLASMGHQSLKEETFIESLILWADKIRTTHAAMQTTEVITTRRLVHICRAYDMFSMNQEKALKLCLARFNAEIQTSFQEFYALIDKDSKAREKERKKAAAAMAKGNDPETPF